MRRTLSLMCAIAVTLSVMALPHPSSAAKRLNIVLIQADDLARQDITDEDMPFLRWLMTQGVTFDNYFVTSSICCVSRASLLRSEYPHTTHVYFNDRWHQGGYKVFHDRGLHRETFAVWLDRAGYRTCIIGKELNDRPLREFPISPGWDCAAVVDNAHPSQNYEMMFADGSIVYYGVREDEHLDLVQLAHARDFLDEATDGDDPFLLFYNSQKPHSPYVAMPRIRGTLAGCTLEPAEPFTDSERSNQPSLARQLRPWREMERDQAGQYCDRREAVRTFDVEVRELYKMVSDEGVLKNTCFVVISDNGMHAAWERGQDIGKNGPYLTDAAIPMVVACPGAPHGVVADQLVANIDIGVTLAEIAGAEPVDVNGVRVEVDGRSFAKLIWEPDAAWTRQQILGERFYQEDMVYYQAEALGIPRREVDRAARYMAIYTDAYSFILYPGTGEIELYLASDAGQRKNLVPHALPFEIDSVSLGLTVGDLMSRAVALTHCRGDECRTLEDLPAIPLPVDMAHAGSASVID